MLRPSLSSPSFFYALILSLALLATSALFLRSLLSALLSSPTPVTTYLTLLRTSPWSLATFADYLTGVVILSTWLSSRPLSSPHFAAALPFLGNSLVYIHTAFILLSTRTPSLAPSPPPRFPSPTPLSCPYVVFVSALTAAYFAILLRAFLEDDLIVGYLELKSQPLVYVTFLDNLMGVALAFAIVAAREESAVVILVWGVGMALLGHGVFGLYAIRVALEASAWGVGVGEAWAVGKRKRDRQYV